MSSDTENTQSQNESHPLIDALNNAEEGALEKALDFLRTGKGNNNEV